jgi:hypothetical protein
MFDNRPFGIIFIIMSFFAIFVLPKWNPAKLTETQLKQNLPLQRLLGILFLATGLFVVFLSNIDNESIRWINYNGQYFILWPVYIIFGSYFSIKNKEKFAWLLPIFGTALIGFIFFSNLSNGNANIMKFPVPRITFEEKGGTTTRYINGVKDKTFEIKR